MFQGSLPALVTPFARRRRWTCDALQALVEWQIAEGSHGLVPVGTTGESPTLSARGARPRGRDGGAAAGGPRAR